LPMNPLDHDECGKDIRRSQIHYMLGLKVVKHDEGDFGKLATRYKALYTTNDTTCECRLQFGQALGNTFSLVVVTFWN